MPKRDFYLVKRPDRLTEKKPTWYCRFRDEDGRLLAWKSTGETSKTRAETWALGMVREREKARPGSDMTLETFAADFFMPGRCSFLNRQAAKGRPVSDSWAQAKHQMLVNHVFPALGKTRLDRLTRPMIERFFLGLPLSPQTINNLLYILKTILGEAEAEGLIARNPLQHSEPMGAKARKRDVFSLEELRKLFPVDPAELLKIWGEAKYAALYTVLAGSGIREGEARALAWRHVLPAGWLAIEQAVKQRGELGAPKNGQARIAALPAKARGVLEWWRERSPLTAPDDLVFFGAERDKPLNRRTFTDILGRALGKAEIAVGGRYLTTHSFRHSHVTMMRRAIPADVLRALVGHRDDRMQAHYDHPQLADLVKSLEGSRDAIEKATIW